MAENLFITVLNMSLTGSLMILACLLLRLFFCTRFPFIALCSSCSKPAVSFFRLPAPKGGMAVLCQSLLSYSILKLDVFRQQKVEGIVKKQ